MTRIFRVAVLLCSALVIGGGVASADTLQFTLTGPVPETFQVSTPLTIMSSEADTGVGFVLNPSQLTGLIPSTGFVAFYNGDPSIGGGLAVFASGTDMVLYASGPQIYGGTELNPTFAPGIFTLDDSTTGTPVPGAYTLTITDLSTVGAPEPSVTILLGIGLLALGLLVLRYKRSFVTTVS
jgi:hypothetical protein